jgi:predicted NBD/HSP70 family sugar kinase
VTGRPRAHRLGPDDVDGGRGPGPHRSATVTGAGPRAVPDGAGPRSAGAGQHTVRRHNLALVLREVATGEPVSRAGVAARTGLTRGTVSSLVEQLIEHGLLTELAATRGGTGRPANPLQLNRSGPAGLGLEIGIDAVGACVVDLTGAVRATRCIASAHRDRPPAAGLTRAARLAAEVIAEAELPISGAAVALPGVVGPDGRLQHAPNLPRWIDVPVDAELSRLLGGIAVRSGNEADLAALAELWFGAGAADFLFVSGGIGVGAGIVLGGELFRGAGGRAGELGHVVVDPDGPRCRCGGRGCLEQVAGQEALLRAAGVATVAELLARPAAAVGPAGRALGIALTGAVHLLDVRTVVLGGIYAGLGAELGRAVAGELAGRVGPVEVRLSRPGTGGALRAAAAWVVRELLRRP